MSRLATLLKNKSQIKLGMAEDLRYVRRREVEILQGRTEEDLREYLEDPNTLYRFPFPGEDGAAINLAAGDPEPVNQRSMFKPALTLFNPDIEIEHREVINRLTGPRSGPMETTCGYSVNVWIPCPYRAAFKDFRHDQLPPPVIYIVGERYLQHAQGDLVQGVTGRTIFGCIYCDAMFSLTTEETTKLVQANQHDLQLTEILNRLLPGDL